VKLIGTRVLQLMKINEVFEVKFMIELSKRQFRLVNLIKELNSRVPAMRKLGQRAWTQSGVFKQCEQQSARL
jgi:hypothetical protein